jgi:hypothetical protein
VQAETHRRAARVPDRIGVEGKAGPEGDKPNLNSDPRHCHPL